MNGGIKILNAEIDAYLCEGCTSLGVEFDGVLTTWQDVEAGMDKYGDLFPRQQAQCGGALMNVFHRASLSESFQCELQFCHERLSIGAHRGCRFVITTTIVASCGVYR